MTKLFLTYDQQLDKLINDKKLIITDRDKAREILKDIGYFSLINGYKSPFINPVTHTYEYGKSLPSSEMSAHIMNVSIHFAHSLIFQIPDSTRN